MCETPASSTKRHPMPAAIAGLWTGILLVGVLDVREDVSRAEAILSHWGLVELLRQLELIAGQFWELLEASRRQAVLENPGELEFLVLHGLGRLLGEEILDSDGYLPGAPTVRCLLQALMTRHLPENQAA